MIDRELTSMKQRCDRARRTMARLGPSLFALAAVVTMACNGDSIVSVSSAERNRAVTVARGQELDITLQTIGPGEYASPPTVSSSSLSFLDVSYLNPVPGGPTQRFRFKAVAAGTAIIAFRHTGTNQPVDDTVYVR